MKEYKKDSNERIKDYFYGILHVDSQSIRTILTNFIDDCREKIKEYLYQFTKKKVQKTLKDFNEYNNSLTINSDELESYATLIRNYLEVQQKNGEIESIKVEIEKMYKLLK